MYKRKSFHLVFITWVSLTLLATTTTGAERNAERNTAVVNGGTENTLEFLQAFHESFLANLGIRKLGDKDIRCIGCDMLTVKEVNFELTELTYSFPGQDSGIARALAMSWVDVLKGRQVAFFKGPTLTFEQTGDIPACIPPYKSPCYVRPNCGGATPGCSRTATGMCQACSL